MPTHTPEELRHIYDARFTANLEYRRDVWSALVSGWFGRFIRTCDGVADLGRGYGKFINAITCGKKFGMDLNPDAPRFLGPGVRFLEQDCSTRWQLPDASLDVVFTSDFLEHLPDKAAVGRTLDEIRRCLKLGGRLIALGPNIKYLPGEYWDFWDHHVALTEPSLTEALMVRRFSVETCIGRFLPYTMSSGPRYPVAFLRAYLKLPLAWRFFGKQFLVITRA
jgi:SAM-dependent methyltransferase